MHRALPRGVEPILPGPKRLRELEIERVVAAGATALPDPGC